MTSLPPDTHIAHAHLQIADLQRSLRFYCDLMGFRLVRQEDRTAFLSADGQEPYRLILTERPDAIAKPRFSTGLYHVAVLLPSRAELGRLVQRLFEHEWPFQGYADHAVSEAFYLADPDGNGLELYQDRPREQWPYEEDGRVRLVNAPLDLQGILADGAAIDRTWDGLPGETAIGHVHLHVADLSASEAFYHEAIGFDIMAQWHQAGASFMAAGGYHHHLGNNVWAGEGAPPPPENAVGLYAYAVLISDEWGRVLRQVANAGIEPVGTVDYGYARGIQVLDPSRNRLELIYPVD